MKILLDTSVLVAAMVEAHPAHIKSLAQLQRIKNGADAGLVSAHTIAELYAILTTLPVKPRISPVIAYELIQHNVFDLCEVMSLSAEDYSAVTKHLSEVGITGGVTYDALILYTAIKGQADRVVTLNEGDFRRIYPQLAGLIISP
jgi:predicted nucleic acid-binding protein